MHVVEFFEILLFTINIEWMKPPLPHSKVGSIMHGRGQAESGEHFATPRILRVVLERGQDADGRLLFQLLYDQCGGIGGVSAQQDMKMFRHEHPTDQSEFHFSAQLPKHIDEMMGQAFTAKQLGASINAGGDKLQMARCIMAMV